MELNQRVVAMRKLEMDRIKQVLGSKPGSYEAVEGLSLVSRLTAPT